MIHHSASLASGRGEEGAAAALPQDEAGERAMALVPGLSFLVRQAHCDGLDQVSQILAGALEGVMRWIEEENVHGRSLTQERH
ncbi:hypothetical protein [Insolitispirillum peregrinum]|uniref:Uncharacterized protein n=1 Tax=Insolitispirillum peregrinum TaxID=80876 RepID=A0A1N7KFJ9_9PROT|nr:hypothetical protein [Insolitispirillum peregrinum]SIS60244.1 hypothetical protein SAMN05421779_102747 [Insolitispirillum peregrinum]